MSLPAITERSPVTTPLLLDSSLKPIINSERVDLGNGLSTMVHSARYKRSEVKARIVYFDKLTVLTDWCHENNVSEAVTGGFHNRDTDIPQGEIWLDGKKQHSEPFALGWGGKRASVYTSKLGGLNIAPRQLQPATPDGSLLEAGPTLVLNGVSTFENNPDPEGFSATASQHDEDINLKRHPRAAIASNPEYIWTFAVDGRSTEDAGMYLDELADYAIGRGVTYAMNLDGGRSANLVSGGRLINTPRVATVRTDIGFGIHSAIVFEPVGTLLQRLISFC